MPVNESAVRKSINASLSNAWCLYICIQIAVSSKLWSSQLWSQLRIEAWSHDFNGDWTRDLALPVQRSNQRSYETTDVRSWSFVRFTRPPDRKKSPAWHVTVIWYVCATLTTKTEQILILKRYTKCFIYRTADVKSIKQIMWRAPNVSGLTAQLVRASHRYREVTGSNPVEFLTFSGFYTQLLNDHNCEDHSLLDFTPAVLYMKRFIYHFKITICSVFVHIRIKWPWHVTQGSSFSRVAW